MKLCTIIVFFILSITINSFGQASNGRVSSLVSAENYFAAKVKENGIRSRRADLGTIFRQNIPKRRLGLYYRSIYLHSL